MADGCSPHVKTIAIDMEIGEEEAMIATTAEGVTVVVEELVVAMGDVVGIDMVIEGGTVVGMAAEEEGDTGTGEVGGTATTAAVEADMEEEEEVEVAGATVGATVADTTVCAPS